MKYRNKSDKCVKCPYYQLKIINYKKGDWKRMVCMANDKVVEDLGCQK